MQNIYPLSTKLAQALNKPLVFFDLEHTGGPNFRATEIGAVILDKDGTIHTFTSYVRPPDHTYFEPYVVRMTGISKESLIGEPSWAHVHQNLVLPQAGSIWVGFGSKGTDLPLVHKESLHCGDDVTQALLHLDLYSLGDLQGKLTDRVLKFWPDADVSNAHRALADAQYTLQLLEGLLMAGTPLLELVHSGAISLTYQKPIPKGERQKPRRPRQACFDNSFFSPVSEGRVGLAWTESEQVWLKSRRTRGDSLEVLSRAVGRTTQELSQWFTHTFDQASDPNQNKVRLQSLRRASLQ